MPPCMGNLQASSVMLGVDGTKAEPPSSSVISFYCLPSDLARGGQSYVVPRQSAQAAFSPSPHAEGWTWWPPPIGEQAASSVATKSYAIS